MARVTGRIVKAVRESRSKGGGTADHAAGLRPSAESGDREQVLTGPCPACGSDDPAPLGVCPSCGQHRRIPARVRLTQVADPGTFREMDADLLGDDPLRFIDTKPYPDRIVEAQERTGLTEAVLTGQARVGGHQVGLAIFDFGFLGGSMGGAVGEKLVRLFERATDSRWPVVVVATSGGARMQEGTVALSQMARVAAAVERHHRAGLLYISVLADPATGGVMISPASMGDIVLAEPGAYAAFAGRRVSGETEPMGAEWLQARGMLDAVVPRAELRPLLIQLLALLTHHNHPLRRVVPRRVENVAEGNAWDTVQLVRREDRPGARDYIGRMTDVFVELHGDRLFGDDAAIVGGIGRFAGQSVIFLGQDRHCSTASHPPGKPYPEGFRKVLRLALLAVKLGLPIITLIDTVGAQADAETEGRGLAFAIGRCLRVFSALPVPVVAAIIGEGGSGAAIALAVADRVLMLEHAIYEVISPEGAAVILYRDAERAHALAERMRITAREAQSLGVINDVVPEPPGGAHVDPELAAELLAPALREALAEAQRWLPDRLLQQRYARLRGIGSRFLNRTKSERREVPDALKGAELPAFGDTTLGGLQQGGPAAS